MADDRISKNLHLVYSALKSEGYTDIGDEQDFIKKMQDEQNRLKVYNALKGAGYSDMGSDFKSFSGMIYTAPQPKPQAAAAPAASPQSSPTTIQTNVVQPVVQTPATQQQTTSAAPREVKKGDGSMLMAPKQEQPSFKFNFTAQTYHGVPMLQNDEKGNPKVSGGTFNPVTGQYEGEGSFYTDWLGNKIPVNSDYGKAAVAYQQHVKDVSPINAELEEAYKERDRINKMLSDRMGEIDKAENDQPWYIKMLREGGRAYAGVKIGGAGSATDYQLKYNSDQKYRNIMSAARKNRAAIKALEDKKNGKQNEFWHAFGNAITNGYTFSQGDSDWGDVNALIDAQKHMPEIERKQKTGEKLTKDEEIAATVIKNHAWDNDVQQRYGDEYGAWARAGETAVGSLELGIDFLTMGPELKATAGSVMKLTEKGATKVLGDAATKGLGKFMTKATGVTVGSMIAGAEMSNTVGLNRTMSDVGKRYLGNVTVNEEDGSYQFDGGKGFLQSLYEAEMAASIENGSEVLGEFLPGSGMLLKGLEKVGMKKVANGLTRLGGSTWYKNYTKALESIGFHGVGGEAVEEYAGLLGNALLVGDNKFSDLLDPKTHVDIWLGCAVTGGLLNAPRTVGYAAQGANKGYQAAQYYRYKHKTDKADAAANAVWGDEWVDLRDRIDGTSNEDMTDIATSIYTDADMTPEQKRTALDYIGNLTAMRGYNMGRISMEREDENGRGTTDDERSLNNAFAAGYNATEQEDMEDAKNAYDMHRQLAENSLDEWTLSALDGNETGIDGEPLNPLHILGNMAYSPIVGDAMTDEQRKIAADYLNAKARYDGMLQRVRDDIDSRISASDAAIDQRTNRVGLIQPATMKLDDRRVYVVDGNLVMHEDGSMIDVANSGESILVRDAETGKLEWASPHDFLSVDEEIDPAAEKEAAQAAIREQYAEEQAQKIDGALPFNDGDIYSVMEEDGTQWTAQILADNGDGTVQVAWNGNVNNPQTVSKDFVQELSTNAAMARLAQNEQERAMQEQLDKEDEFQQERPVYNLNDEVTLRGENGEPVRGSITTEENEDGQIEVYTETPINGKKIHMFTRQQIDDMLMEHNGEAVVVTEAPAITAEIDNAGAVQSEPSTVQNDVENVPETTENVSNTDENVPAAEETVSVEPMPMVGEGEDAEPDFGATTPQRAHDYIFNESGLEEADAAAFTKNNVEAANKELEKIKNKKPKMGTSIAKFNKDKAEWEQKVNEAQAKADYWKQVKEARDKVLAQRLAEQQERERQKIEQAQADEAAYREEMARKEAEQAALGTNNVSPAIRDKWVNAPKVEGAQDEIVLPNGEKVAGRYYLVESGAASASHDSNNGFAKTEGFPVDENGVSVNDRDYERDMDAQRITRDIANNYDSRAVQTPVVVSQDGVVLSGNGRTMAGELAAAQNTDAAYNSHIAQYPTKWGFTQQQVEGMQHPRVVFVPDAAMPYTAETFAKFNQQEMKGQSKTEQAVKLGKVVSDKAFNRIIGIINRFDTLGDFYADSKATSEAITELQGDGVLSQAQMAEMYDGDGISAIGKELLENTLIGKAFESNPNAVREITGYKSMRQSIITALAEISNNLSLGKEYSLESELAQAIDLVYQARKGGSKFGEPVSWFARQQNLDFFGFSDTVADYNNATMLMIADIINDNRSSRLKKYLQIYNHNAHDWANGQLDLFTGSVHSKEDIINEVKQLFNNGSEEEQQKAAQEAVARRKAESVHENGTVANGIEAEPAGEVKTEGETSGTVAEKAPAITREKMLPYMQQFLMETNGDMRLLDNITDEELQKFLGLLDAWEEVNDTLGASHNANEKYLNDKNKAIAKKAKEAIDFAEQLSSDAFVPVQNYYNELCDKYGITDEEEPAAGATGTASSRYDEAKEFYRKNYSLQPLLSQLREQQRFVKEGRGDKEVVRAILDILNEDYGIDEHNDLATAIAAAEAATEANPTDAQKEAGNYKKGHVKIDGYDVTIENPKGSVRRGTDASGKQWQQEMHNTYGYIRGTEGVDGDHIDIFLSDDPANGNVFVIDQVKADGTFDEHKVMYGFASAEEARDNYLANYSEGWTGLGTISEVTKDEFKKWIESSHRKTKPFADYKGVKVEGSQNEGEQQMTATTGAFGTIYTQFKGKAKEAIYWLKSKKEGEAAGALHHHSIGDISLVWGDEKTGLAKIVKKHPEVLDNLQDIIDGMEIVQESDNRIKLESDTHFAVVSKEYKGEPREKWLLTAYEKKETSEPANSRMDVESNLEGKSDDTATRQDSDVSSDKVTYSTSSDQENGVKSYKITPEEYTTKRGRKLAMHLVTFGRELSKEEIRAGKELAKESRGWWDREKGGFMMRDEDSAKALAEALSNEEAVQDAQPLSVEDVATVTDHADMKSVDETIKVEQEPQTTPQYDYDREDSVYDTVLSGLREAFDNRDAGLIPNIKAIEKEIRDLRKRAKAIEDGMATAAGETIPQAFDALANLNGKRRAYEQFLVDIRKKMAETERDNALAAHGVKLGDKIMYKGKEATIHDADSRQVTLDVGLAPVLYDVTDWENVELPKREPATPQPKKVNVESLMGELGRKGEAKLSDHTEEQQQEESTEQPKQEEKKAKSKWVDDADAERFEELRRRLRMKLGGQLNMGLDPEAFAIGVEMSYLMLKHGSRKFGEFAKNLIEALGEGIRPYVKTLYNGARDLPEMADIEKDMTPWDEVRTFDVMNFDKDGAKDIIATAEHIVREQAAEREAKEATDKLKQQRNEQRKETEQEVAANTAALASEAATVASETESKLTSARNEQEVNDLAKRIDEAIDKVNDQLALLGYYEAEPVESDFNEAYGYMRNAEKKAVKNITELFKTLTKELGISDPVVYDAKGKKQKSVTANIAPAGGDVTMRFMLNRDKGVELYIDFMLEPDYENNRDNLVLKGIMYRPERNLPNGGRDYLRANNFFPVDVTIPQMLQGIRSVCQEWLPKEDYVAMAQRIAAENAGGQQVKPSNERKSKKKSVSLQEQTIPDLFSSFFSEEFNPTSNEQEVHVQPRTSTTERERGHQREQNEPLGESKQNEDERPDGQGMGGRSSRNTVSDGERSLGVSGIPKSEQYVEAAKPEGEPSETVAAAKNTNNNHAERGKDYAPKGVDARIEANIKAIELMQQLMLEGKQATPAQMKVLRQYSGWGGLGKAFNENPSGPYSYNPTPKRLKELLGDDAYEQANMSRNSAYYTPALVIDTMWDIARAMGFKGGTVLEGSAGIGNIIGAMPTDMSKRSDIHAVEIDETTGNILSLLYPDAKVEVQGFEATKVANGSVDLAITNVPFVTGLRVLDTTGDKDLSKKFHDIHDFCIAKNVRKLREGGIGIFITSNGTLDNSQKLRNWLVSEGGSDVVGAFRLHNETFGGTGATSDIIVVRKRVNGQKSAHAIDVSTVTAERTATFTDESQRGKERTVSMDYNKYFIEHPECMAGEMHFAFEKGDTYRATSKALYPAKGKNQGEMLAEWLKGFEDMKEETQRGRTANSSTEKHQDTVYESLGSDVKEGSLILDKDGKLCVAQYGKAVPLSVNANKVKGHTKAECFQSYQAIKSALADVLAYQTENEGDEGLKPLLDKLNKAYDDFVKTYGHLHKNTSISFLKNDVDFPNILALEKHSEEGDKKGNKVDKFEKTDIFKQRVVEKDNAPEPKNVKDGIIASIYQYGRIDVPYIAEKVGKSVDDVKQEIVSSGLGFENPNTLQMEVSYEYLSGNVREKLKQAEEANEGGKYAANIEALRNVIPMDIPAHLIDFTLGSSWVEPKLYEEFIKERTDVDAQLTNVGGTWYMKVPYYVQHEKNKAMGVRGEVVKKLILGSELIEAALQNKTITVSETRSIGYGSSKTTETITDKEATQACAAKIDEIRADFKEWARQKMQSDAEMSARIEKVYNEQFNNYVPVDVSMDFVPKYFGGANHRFQMRPHQAKAIVRGTMQPLLLAHEVGTGKTFTLISTAMEMRRLGTAKKPMIVVQNATVGQFVASAKELYPNAKVLTLEDKDRNEEGRKNFYAKIKYNDWDMIVVPQSVFERIPDSEERQMRFIQDKIDEKIAILEQMREADQSGRSAIVRQAKKEIEQLKDQLGAIGETATTKRKQKDEKKEAVTRQNAEVKAREMLDRETDDVENFDDMGIDALLVDEAHEYKHLGFATAMQRGVKGIDPSYSKKSQGVYLKTQAVLEKNNGRNVIFATGTPISNTAAEIWTFMRYLMPADTMKDYGIYYFDDFVRNFGNLTQMLEFTTNGKFKENNRFAGYVNLPELVRIWSSVADTVRTDEAQAVKDNVPDMEGGQAQDIYLPQTRALRSIMKFVKAELERFEKMSGKEKKENSHIPLTMYGVAKAAAVDARLVMEDAEDDTNSKTNEAVRQTLKSLKETAKYKGTVALFADNYQNKHSGFNLYDDIREKLIAQGVPANEVVVIRSGMTIKKKQEIFDKVNRGEIRVILGSTFTLGTGVNIQERLHTLIHLDAPNRPMDYTQRNGRIVRQGNLHKVMGIPVRVLRFGVQDSLDVTAYQRLKTKGSIADSIMKGKAMMQNSMEDRAMEEDEDVFGDTVAQLSGSQYAMLKNQAEREVRKYESKRKQWEADQTYVHNAIPRITAQIAESERKAAENNANLANIEEAFGGSDTPAIKVGKHTFSDIAGMADFFTEQNKKVKETEDEIRKSAGEEQRTRTVDVQIGNATFTIKTTQKKELTYHGGTVDTKVSRSITISCPELGIEDMKGGAYFKNAMENIFNDIVSGSLFREDAAYYTTRTERLKGELELVKSREGQPFQYEKELADARQKLDEYTDLMKKEMEEKEKKYAEMDSEVDAATGVTVNNDEEEENDNLYRIVEDEIPVSDSEISEMVNRVNELASKLHLDNIEIVTDASTLSGDRRRANGFYNRNTGKITIVVANHTDLADLEKTVLHESVAHHGLRKLFGEHFNTFLDNVFRNADADVRKRITELAAKHGWNFRTATEEYLAGLAEDTDFENAKKTGWWEKVKRAFLDMLHKIGFDEYDGDVLTDNELRYILWRSYSNLENGEHGIIKAARNEVMKERLGVGNYGVDDNTRSVSAEAVEEDDIFFRDGDIMDERDHAIVRDRYDRMIQSGMYQFREAVQDSMLSLRRLMEYISEATGEKVRDFENAYMAENALSSKNHAEQDLYGKLLFNPMLDEIHLLAKEDSSRDEVTRYMMAKHGLERNEVMAARAAKKAFESEDNKDASGNPIKSEADFLAEYRERDFGGITGLMDEDDLVIAEGLAQQLVSDFENNHDVDELWARTNACTKATLEKTYKAGLLSKSGYDEISGMYEYYIPLRGFDATTSDEVYSYLNHERSGFSTPLKKAEGRKSVADDPIATIANMADSAIVQGNRNMMKQKFLKFAMNHPSDAVSVNRMWLRYDDVNDVWEAVTAQIDENDTPDEVLQKTEQFEETMKQLAEADPDHYKRGKDAANIPYKTLGKSLNEHQVHVKLGGDDYILTINGSPRAAQALNGLTNPDNDTAGAVGAILKAGEYVNRQMSAFYTTRNPEFVLSNFLRDAIYANSTMWVRERPNYAIKFNKNFLKVNPKVLYGLIKKHNAGKLDMNVEIERAFYQFMMNGGETGYTVVKDIDKQKKLIKKYVRMKDSTIPVEAAWQFLGDKLDDINRSVENCARFAAFLTSRQMGRTVERSVFDAKEVSVNFNKKGAGSTFMGKTDQTKLGNLGAFTSGLGRSFYVFWNAAVQGTTNFASLHKHHTSKALMLDAGIFLLGAIISGLGGGDDDDYWNLPSYVRRSNICFKIPFTDSFVSIPLGIEQRAIYGLGELFSSLASGRERMSGKEIAKEIAGSLSSMLPLDLMESNGDISWSTVSPSYVKPFVETANNKDWKGMPIYKDTPYNKDDPEWTKASKRTNQYLVDFSKWCNEVTGGDEVKKGWLNFNPSKIEHVFEGVLGGVSTTANKLVKAGEIVAGKQEFDWSNILIASRVVKSADKNAEARRINAEYWKYYGEYKETKRLVDHYEDQESEGIMGAAEKLNFMYNSPEYGRYEIVDDYYSEVKDLSDELNETTNEEERKELETEINELKREMVEAIRAYDDDRK